jgi:cyclohexa-1,5-dienecarbonyl-CoA hydratase
MGRVDTTLLRDGAVLRLVFNGGKGNILTGALMRELEGTLADHERTQALKLVLLTGAGRHFSFGASVEEHRRAEAPAMLGVFQSLLLRLLRFPTPTLALVEGQCLGGAFELGLACDFVYASPSAMLGCPEIKLGVFAPALAALGPVRVGPAHTMHLMLTGESMGATSAMHAGAVTRVVDGSLEDAALAFFDEHLAPRSAFAVRATVKAARHGSGIPAATAALSAAIQQYIEEIVPSHDGDEGIEAFLARRTPVWEHR